MTSEQTPETTPLPPKEENKPIKLASKTYSQPQLTLFGEVKNLTLGSSLGGVDSLGEALP